MESDLHKLLSAREIRQRCHTIYRAARDGKTSHFKLDLDKLPACVDFVLTTIQENYPDLDIPYHSRWRHFVVDDIDYWEVFKREKLFELGIKEQTRIALDLVFVSVLLDAGAGSRWQYKDKRSGKVLTRSEGLAIASFNMFCDGLFSASTKTSYRVDANALLNVTEEALAQGFQSNQDNPLIGVLGRAELLQGLGSALLASGNLERPGDLYDTFKSKAKDNRISAEEILDKLLTTFGAMWPNGLTIDKIALGDTGRHKAIQTDDVTSGLIPFHKLSQWLSYSIIEPLEWAGIQVTEIDKLTGLPEYRNGGLLLDFDVLQPSTPELLKTKFTVNSEAIVEWRGLTIALLDLIAQEVRESLQKSKQEMPLAKVLQGGTWAAGRKIAKRKRPDSSPPVKLDIDGTVF